MQHIGGSLSVTKGQYSTLQCLAVSQGWKYTLRKLISMVYTDEELSGYCAIEKAGAKNKAIDPEDLGAMKG